VSELLALIASGAKPLIGMIQLPPLAGSSRYIGGSIDDVVAHALRDAAILDAAGFDCLMLQNLGDVPVAHRVSASQVAWMSRVATEIQHHHRRPLGLNFLENDAEAMFAVAGACGIDFVRIKTFVGATVGHNGIDEAQCHTAIKARNAVHAHDVAILADIHDRTSTPLATAGFGDDVAAALTLGGADALVLTGRSHAETMQLLETARTRSSLPLVVGGGVDAGNVHAIFDRSDAAIVSSVLRSDRTAFGLLDPERVTAFVASRRG
jgi:membrane complex biogenesis BtpA family protein